MKHHHGVVDPLTKQLENEHIDPVCGMTVQAERAAATYEYKGQRYYFCSATCADKFKRSPNTYVSEPAPRTHCDPVCGMDVTPEEAAGLEQYQGRTYYFCSTSCQQKFRKTQRSTWRNRCHHHSGNPPSKVEYTAPWIPRSAKWGRETCPKCGMALEPPAAAPVSRVEYTCPMHPEIIRSEPGSCPICGMALEPREITGEEVNPELVDMTRRFWVSMALTIPILAFMVSEMIPSHPLQHWLGSTLSLWLQFALASPVVLWGGWPFFHRGWLSVKNRSLNMFTLIAMGTGAAYVYSVFARHSCLPASFRDMAGRVWPLF